MTTLSIRMISETLKHLAKNEEVKQYILEHEEIYNLIMKSARDFIGGETMDECFLEVNRLNKKGIATTIDFCGENTMSEEHALQATSEFIRLIDKIANQKLDSSISFDLSHIGLSIDGSFLEENLKKIVSRARQRGVEVMISMEDRVKLESILDHYSRLASDFENLGITLQAYQKGFDYQRYMAFPGKIRIVKGAFEESNELVLDRGPELNSRYLQILEMCLASNKKVSIGTHDLDLIDQVINMSSSFGKGKVEFEMLHGVNEARLVELRRNGFRVRDYLIYGREWYLYYCNRLAENPENFIRAFHKIVFT